MILESSARALYQTELDRVFYQDYNSWTEAFPSLATAETAAIFKPMTTTHGAYIEEVFKGSPLFAEVGETQTIPENTPTAGNKLTTYIKDYAASVSLSKDAFDDNLHGFYNAIISNLALKARVTQTSNAFGVFRGAFTTTLTADGAALCSSHTLLNGQTYSNALTAALTVESLKDAIVKMGEQPDEAGVIMGVMPAYLVVPQALFVHATQITQSQLVADSGNNNLNVYRSAFGFTIYTSPFLGANAGGSDTAWFLLAKNHSITRLVRQGIQTYLRGWEMSNNRTYLYQANFRETVYVPNYVGVIGSTGLS